MWKGEPAQYWIGRLNFFDLEGASASAEEFLFAAGPQVVPELIRGLSMPDNWLTDCRSWLYFKLGKWQRHFQMPAKPAEYRSNCAIGLGLLGPAASNAVPALLRAFREAFWAAWELGRRGKAAASAIEPLCHLAKTTSDWRTEVMAQTAAWRIDPSIADPFNLITNHLSQRENGQYEIVRLLGELGPAARPAVPVLRQLRYCRGRMMHDYANEALERVASEYIANPWQK